MIERRVKDGSLCDGEFNWYSASGIRVLRNRGLALRSHTLDDTLSFDRTDRFSQWAPFTPKTPSPPPLGIRHAIFYPTCRFPSSRYLLWGWRCRLRSCRRLLYYPFLYSWANSEETGTIGAFTGLHNRLRCGKFAPRCAKLGELRLN